MASRIIIDGYNLIKTSHTFDIRHNDDLQDTRDRLIDTLNKYYYFRKIPITVVFDGWKGGGPTENRDIVKKIHVIYSRLGETADEVIKRLTEKNGSSCIVVTSDKDVANFAEIKGAAVITSAEFENKLRMTLYTFKKGIAKEEEDEDDELDRPITTKKRGNPRKLPRSERKRKKRLDRL